MRCCRPTPGRSSGGGSGLQVAMAAAAVQCLTDSCPTMRRRRCNGRSSGGSGLQVVVAAAAVQGPLQVLHDGGQQLQGAP